MMKKNILFKLAGLVLLVVGFAACDTADQDTAPVISPENKPTAVFTPSTSYSTVTEGDTVIYNVSIDKTIDRSLTATARLVEGTIDEDDFVVLPGIIRPYTTSAAVTVIFNQDWDAEDAETVKFEFGVFSVADRYMLHTNTVNPTLDLTINNYVSDVLTITLDWGQEIIVEEIIEKTINVGTYNLVVEDTVEASYDLADEIDYDIYVSEAASFDITDPYASEIGIYTAATGDSPEKLELSGLDDGEYVIWADLYRNYVPEDGFYSLSDSTQKAIITGHFVRQGTDLDLTIVQDSTQAPLIYETGYSPAATRRYVYGVIANVIVANGTYTIVDFDGTQSGPWKGIAVEGKRPNLTKMSR